MSFTFIAGGLIYYYFIGKLLPWFIQLAYCFFLFSLICVYTVNLFANPGVIIRNRYDNKVGKYCLICKIYVPDDLKADHCSICNVCIEGN